MSNVIVWFEGKAEEYAILLLDAAEQSQDYDAAAVQTVSGGFRVPEELAEAAGLDYTTPEKPDLAVREAEIPGAEDTVEVHHMGAGPTGEVQSNVDFDEAESGTVQNEQGEQEMGEPRSDPPARKTQSRRRGRKSQPQDDQQESTANEEQE